MIFHCISKEECILYVYFSYYVSVKQWCVNTAWKYTGSNTIHGETAGTTVHTFGANWSQDFNEIKCS